MSTFKVGDRVRLTGEAWAQHGIWGEVHTVVEPSGKFAQIVALGRRFLEVGDRLWEVRRQKLGNTTMSADAVFDVVVREIRRRENGRFDSALCSWNGNQPKQWFLGGLMKLRTCYPVLGKHILYDRNDDTYLARVERDKKRNAEDKKRWQEKRKAARAKATEVPR